MIHQCQLLLLCPTQNGLDLSMELPQAARAVEDSLYFDDGLTN